MEEVGAEHEGSASGAGEHDLVGAKVEPCKSPLQVGSPMAARKPVQEVCRSSRAARPLVTLARVRVVVEQSVASLAKGDGLLRSEQSGDSDPAVALEG